MTLFTEILNDLRNNTLPQKAKGEYNNRADGSGAGDTWTRGPILTRLTQADPGDNRNNPPSVYSAPGGLSETGAIPPAFVGAGGIVIYTNPLDNG